MLSAFDASLSGIRAATTRLGVASNNIANQFSTQRVADGVVTNEPYEPVRVAQISQATGGTKAELRAVENPVRFQFEPENPIANAEGLVAYPNVDTAEQLVEMKIASYDFKSNLKAIQVQNNMLDRMLDILA